MAAFISLADGEYALCPNCKRIGYGIDSWHPVTTEFWRQQTAGKLDLTKCKACRSETAAKRFGVLAA